MSNNTEAGIQFINFLVKESHLLFKEPGNQKIAIGFSAKGFIFKDVNQFHLQLGVNKKGNRIFKMQAGMQGATTRVAPYSADKK